MQKRPHFTSTLPTYMALISLNVWRLWCCCVCAMRDARSAHTTWSHCRKVRAVISNFESFNYASLKWSSWIIVVDLCCCGLAFVFLCTKCYSDLFSTLTRWTFKVCTSLYLEWESRVACTIFWCRNVNKPSQIEIDGRSAFGQNICA